MLSKTAIVFAAASLALGAAAITPAMAATSNKEAKSDYRQVQSKFEQRYQRRSQVDPSGSRVTSLPLATTAATKFAFIPHRFSQPRGLMPVTIREAFPATGCDCCNFVNSQTSTTYDRVWALEPRWKRDPSTTSTRRD